MKGEKRRFTGSGFCSFSEFCVEAKRRLAAAQEGEYMIFSLDIDNFKYVNDLFGYKVGTQVLSALLDRFKAVSKEDSFFCRTHADHFLFFTPTADSFTIKRAFAALKGNGEGFAEILPQHYTLVFSGGVFVIKHTAEALPTMIDKANFARKAAKGFHMSNFRVYDDAMASDLDWKREITVAMGRMLKEGEFELYLQPKVHLQTGMIIGAEALVRWNSKKHGLLTPDRFIPIFEQNGFIKLLDFYMLEQVCLYIESERMNPNYIPIPISVNFSKVHIGTHKLVDRIYATVRKHKIPPNLIEIELTESIMLKDLQAVVNIANSLQQLGFKVSVDDFGSEYSSLGCLKDMPVNIVKIDKSFLNSSTNTEKGRLIIAKVIEMVKAMKLIAVVEGIETQEQVEFLRTLNCDIGQGFHYAKPMPWYEFKRRKMQYESQQLIGFIENQGGRM